MKKRARAEIAELDQQKRAVHVALFVFQKVRPRLILFHSLQQNMFMIPTKKVDVPKNTLKAAVEALLEFHIPHYIVDDFKERCSQDHLRTQHQHSNDTILFHPVHSFALELILSNYEGQVEFLDIIDLIAPSRETLLHQILQSQLNALRHVALKSTLITGLSPATTAKSYVRSQIAQIETLDYEHYSILPTYILPQSSQRYVLVQSLPGDGTLDLIGSWRTDSFSKCMELDPRHIYYRTHGSHHQYIWLSMYRSIILEMSVFTSSTFKWEPRLQWIRFPELLAYCQGSRSPRKPGHFMTIEGNYVACRLTNRLYELFRDADLTGKMLCSLPPASMPQRIESPVTTPNMMLTMAVTTLGTVAIRSFINTVLNI